jgi:mRNA-degrading endonuclease RelE of RelBE toxin-antitoxin system
MNYDVFIERNVLNEIKKFPAHDVDWIKKGRVGGAVGAQPGPLGCVQAGAVTTG